MRTQAQWLELVRCSVAGLTQAQSEEVADRCHAAEQAGNMSSVWHEAAAVCGALRCPCFQCNPRR